MNIEKLKSGSYRIRKTYNGKKYTITLDHKPTKSEAEMLIMQQIGTDISRVDQPVIPFLAACDLYIESNRERLSPSTITDYKRIPGRLPQWFLALPLCDITQNDINKLVNERIADGKSPKTIRNEHGFVATVLHEYRPDFTVNTKLPRPEKKSKEENYIPTPEEVDRIIEYSKGGRYWCVMELAKLGLRRGEICAIDGSKISDTNILTIDDSLVVDEDNNYVLHGDTKTLESRREIPVSQEVADYIREHNGAYSGNPHSINRWLLETEKKLGIPRFTLHKMRYYFATQLDQAGIPRADAHRLGGWSPSSDVYERVYRQDEIDRDMERKRDILNAVFGKKE